MIRNQPKNPLVEADPEIYSREDLSEEELQAKLLEARQMRDKKESSGGRFGRIKDAWENFRGRGHIDLAKLVSDEDAIVTSNVERRRIFEADALSAIDLVQDKNEKIKMQQKLHEELLKMKEVEKKALDQKKKVELRFKKRKAEVEALEREMNNGFDEKVRGIEVEEGYKVNKERQARMEETIASLKKDLDEHTRIVGELKAISAQLEQGVKSRGKLRAIFRREYRDKDFQATLNDIPAAEGEQLSADEKKLRERAKDAIKEYHEVDGMSLENIIEQNKNLLEENTKEVEILKGKLAKIIKSKQKVDAVCIRAEARIGKVEQERRKLDLKKSESKDLVEVKPYKDAGDFKSSREALKLVDSIRDADGVLNKIDNYFDKKTIESSKNKGIDSIKDKVKAAFAKRNGAVNEIRFNLEESNRRIDKTLEGKGLKDKFKADLEDRKKKQLKIIEELENKIVDIEGDWKSIKEQALVAFPDLVQTNKTESSIEDPVERFEEILSFIDSQNQELTSAQPDDQESIKLKISRLCVSAARTIGDMGMDAQYPAIELLTEKIDSLGSTLTPEVVYTVFQTLRDGIIESIGRLDMSEEEKILLIADTGIRFSKEVDIPDRKSHIIQGFFDRAYKDAQELVKSQDLPAVGMSQSQKVDVGGESPLLKAIYEKAIEAGLNEELKSLEIKKDEAVELGDIESLVANMNDMLQMGNDMAAIEAFMEYVNEHGEDPFERLALSVEVLSRFPAENAVQRGRSGMDPLIQIRELAMSNLAEVIEASGDDYVFNLTVSKSISEVVGLYAGISGNERYIPELVGRIEDAYLKLASNPEGNGIALDSTLSVTSEFLNNDVLKQNSPKFDEIKYELYMAAEKKAGNRPDDLRKVAKFVFEKDSSVVSRNFVIDIYVKIAQDIPSSSQVIDVATEMIDLFSGNQVPYLKDAAVRIFEDAERNIMFEDNQIKKTIDLYFTMNTLSVIDRDDMFRRLDGFFDAPSDQAEKDERLLSSINAISEQENRGVPRSLIPDVFEKVQARLKKRIDLTIRGIKTFSDVGEDYERASLEHALLQKMTSDIGYALTVLETNHSLDDNETIFGSDWEKDHLTMIEQVLTIPENLMSLAKTARAIEQSEIAAITYGRILDTFSSKSLDDKQVSLIKKIILEVEGDKNIDSSIKESVTTKAINKMINLAANKSAVEEAIHTLEGATISEASKFSIYLDAFDKLFSFAGENIDEIESAVAYMSKSVDRDYIKEALQKKFIISDNYQVDASASNFNTELADLMIELGFTQEGENILKSMEPVQEEPQPENSDVIEGNVDLEDVLAPTPKDLIAESKARRLNKKKPKQEEKKGFWSSLKKAFQKKK